MQKVRECRDCVVCDIKAPIFTQLTQDDLTIINQDRFVVKYQPGELLFKQGSSFTHIIMVIKGLVKSYFEGTSKDLILSLSKPIELLTSASLFQDAKHPYSARALSETEACYISFEHFKEVFYRNPHFAEDVVKDISVKNLFSLKRMMSLTQKQVPGRVAEAILYFSNHIYNKTSFDLNLSRQELADFCSATKESIIRVLRDFKEEELIKVEGNHFELFDSAMLQKISELG